MNVCHRTIYICFFFGLFAVRLHGQVIPYEEPSVPSPSPKYEFRGAWVTTLGGKVWPKTNDPVLQRQDLEKIFDRLRQNNFNAVLFQVRARGDAMYPSRFEPFAASLTGKIGGKPEYDPLKFAIEHAHQYGLEFHAWWNVCKVADGNDPPPLSNPAHVVNLHPTWVKRWKNKNTNGNSNGNGHGSVEWWIDIGIPEARTWLVDVAMELVEKYDIDAINFDYLRYPGQEFDDRLTYDRYGGSMSLDEWRRHNVTSFLREFYNHAIALKPHLKVGAAPIGIYQNLENVTGWQAYSTLYQDTKQWLKEGIIDYIIPQLYWELYSNPRFNILLRDWQADACGRHIYAGIGAFRSSVLPQIPAMIDSVRIIGAGGQCYFTYNDVRDGSIFQYRYSSPAIIPPMPWKHPVVAEPPRNLRITETSSGVFKLEWDPSPELNSSDKPTHYIVYRSETLEFDIKNADCMISVLPSTENYFIDLMEHPESAHYYYFVTAVNNSNVESQPSNEVRAEMKEAIVMRQRVQMKTLLAQNYQNPAEKETFLTYQLGSRLNVRLTVFDQSGNEVEKLVDAVQGPGMYSYPLFTFRLSKGIYRYTLTTDIDSLSKYFFVK